MISSYVIRFVGTTRAHRVILGNSKNSFNFSTTGLLLLTDSGARGSRTGASSRSFILLQSSSPTMPSSSQALASALHFSNGSLPTLQYWLCMRNHHQGARWMMMFMKELFLHICWIVK